MKKNKVDELILKVVKCETVEERMQAMQEYNMLVVKPLEEKLEKQQPMVELASKRLDSKGCFPMTDVSELPQTVKVCGFC